MREPEDITWELAPYSWAAAERLARELALPFPVATVLAARGLADPVEARTFLDCSVAIPDPFLFADMEVVVGRLTEAIERGDRIVIHGDYDADGVTATAVMVLGLRAMGAEVDWYLPSRFAEGFGLSRTAVESIASRGQALLVTVDCGVNYPDEVRLAQELGLDVIVIDHHQPGPVLPDCPLVHRVKGEYPHDHLCGVGLAFKVLHALHVRSAGASTTSVPEALHPLLDLVAVGTIADLVPLKGENRFYVREGLRLLTIGTRVGLRALSKVAGCAGAVDSGAVSFRLAPRLNAAGRLADASQPLCLLLTDDEKEAMGIAARLHELNGERQDVERQILQEAIVQVEGLESLPPLLVLSGEGWHEGVVGIVASRMVERYHRPALLLGERDGVAKGSGRSISRYDLMAGLNACAQWLTIYGGHPQAVGLTLPVEQVESFRQAMQEHAAERLTGDDVRPLYRADAVLRGDDVNADTALALASLGPFGSGNPRPRVLLVNAAIGQVDVTRTGAHLRCVVEVDGAKARAIGFGMGELAPSLREDGRGKTVGAQLLVDEWQGSLRPELRLEGVGATDAAVRGFPLCGPGCRNMDAAEAGAGDSFAEGEAGAVAPALHPSSRRARPSSQPVSLTLSAHEGRDLRGAGGRMGAVAQVLATGEPTVILTCSVAHCLDELRRAMPLGDFTRGRLCCVGRGCLSAVEGRVDGLGVTIVEWDVATDLDFMGGEMHVIAADPPYTEEHVLLLRRLAHEGAKVHLYYGEEQRQTTVGLLKYLAHPRFAMVCVYRARSGGSSEHEIARVAADLAWREARVVLPDAAFVRATQVLAELDLEHSNETEAKISLATIPLYARAEADYEECCRLCRTL